MRESHFQRDLVLQLRGVGCLVFNVHGHAMQQSGWPDLQVYSPIWTGHLELKTKGGLEELQRFRIQELRRRGTAAFCLRLRPPDIIIEDFETLEDWCDLSGREQAKELLLTLRRISEPIWEIRRRTDVDRFLP